MPPEQTSDDEKLELRELAEGLARRCAEKAECEGLAFPSAAWRARAEVHVRYSAHIRLRRAAWPVQHAVELLDSMVRDGFIS